MSRTGFLIVAALIFALAAAAVLVWTNNLQLPGTSSPAPTTQEQRSVTAPSPSVDWIQQMNQFAGSSGFVATFSAADTEKWMISEGHKLERFSFGGNETVLARFASTSPLVQPPKLDGLYIELPVEFAAAANGKKIEVGVVARSAKSNPAQSFDVIYFTRKLGNTGWLDFKLSPEFELKTFDYEVPLAQDGYAEGPVIAIYGDPAGGDKGVELLGLYVKLKQ